MGIGPFRFYSQGKTEAQREARRKLYADGCVLLRESAEKHLTRSAKSGPVERVAARMVKPLLITVAAVFLIIAVSSALGALLR